MESLQKRNNFIVDSRASSILFRYLINKQQKGIIVLPVNICPIVVETIISTGFTPYYIDINRETLCVEEGELLDSLNLVNPKGVLINHTYGVTYNFYKLVRELRKKWNGFIIEDKCLCIPDINLEFDVNVDLLLYSTGYAKYVELDYAGGYGIFNYNNSDSFETEIKEVEVGDKKLLINNFKINTDSYFNDISSSVQKTTLLKKSINDIYDQYLSEYSLGKIFSTWRYNILVQDKDRLLKDIFNNGLFASSHYKPISDDKIKFPTAWYIYDHVVNLFNDQYFNLKKAVEISIIVNTYDPIQ